MRTEAITQSMANEMLKKGRESLNKLRPVLIMSSAEIIKNPSKTLWHSIYRHVSEEEEKTIIELINPAKQVLRKPITVKDVEAEAEEKGGNFALAIGLPYEFGVGTVRGRIEITTKLQRELKVAREQQELPVHKQLRNLPPKIRIASTKTTA